MKRLLVLIALAPSLWAHDPSVSCLAKPLSGLAGNYTFHIEGISPHLYGITGKMNARIGANAAGAPVGTLTITASSFFDSALRQGGRRPSGGVSVTRLETDLGSFQVNPECTGGTLTFNLSSHPMQFDFWFLDGGRRLYLVSTINGLAATGVAVAAPNGCPAGLTDPLQLLPVRWAFTARGPARPGNTDDDDYDDARVPTVFASASASGAVNAVSTNDPYAIAGFWNASVALNRANLPVGLLAITATSNLGRGGSVTRLETDAGSFQANADCSGGTLTFNLSSRPVQFDFWYVDGFQKMYFVATNNMPVVGEASR